MTNVQARMTNVGISSLLTNHCPLLTPHSLVLHATIHAARRDAPTNLLPLPVTFEAAAAALELLPRMFFEPDGSFVWVGETDAGRWQLDGQLQDRGPTLDHVEIKGTCAPEPFAQFLTALRGDANLLVFQQVQAGEILDEAAAVGLLAP